MKIRGALALLWANYALGNETWGDQVHALIDPSISVEQFKELVGPMVSATKISYTGNTSEAVPGGFELVEHAAPKVGLNAVSYWRKDDDKLLIAFRGTTTDSDTCADWYIWENKSLSLDKKCSAFDKDTIDYISRAKDFTRSAIRKTNSSDILFTGHSLGSGLATFMTLAFSQLDPRREFHSVSFGPPITEPVIERLRLNTTFEDRIVTFRNPQDPITEPTKLQVGYFCSFTGVRKTIACSFCKHPDIMRAGHISPGCMLCFEATHIYKHYLETISNMKTLPQCSLSSHHAKKGKRRRERKKQYERLIGIDI